jgi:hypothetical protein
VGAIETSSVMVVVVFGELDALDARVRSYLAKP